MTMTADHRTYRAGMWRVAAADDGAWGLYYGWRMEPVATFLSLEWAIGEALHMAATQPVNIHQQAISGEMN